MAFAMTSTIDPLKALASSSAPAVLAVITGIDGPSYRPVGAMMAVLGKETLIGTLSSGCVESDIAIHAAAALERGHPVSIRYGRGSPFIDIQLPCGGGLDIMLVPNPDRNALAKLVDDNAKRIPRTLRIDRESGLLSVEAVGETGWDGSTFNVRVEPELFFYVFGKGPEASTFAALVQSAGYPNLVLSPDQESLSAAIAAGCQTRHLRAAEFPADISADNRSAIVLFFHDHDWEPPILAGALKTDAFYVGAQGSQRARESRLREMEVLHRVDPESLGRVKGPIGLVRSARDARTLAVSVLAEVLSEVS